MTEHLIRMSFVALLSGLHGCTLFVAAAGYPSAPTAGSDTYHTLLLDYKYGEKIIPIRHNWHCSYKSVWAANNGWTLQATSSATYFVTPLDATTYLYASVAPCHEEGNYIPALVEIRNLASRPEAKLISPGFYEKCKSRGGASNVVAARVTRSGTRQSDTEVSEADKRIIEEIQKYEYAALPVSVFKEQQWSQYPALANNVRPLQAVTTPKQYNARFLHDPFFDHQFPNLPFSSDDVIFAVPTDSHWEVIEGQRMVLLWVRKTGSNEPTKKDVHYKGTVLSDWSAVYDPDTKAFYRWGFTQKCF